MSRILVIEDSQTQALKIQFILEDAGFEVEVATNGKQGLALFASKDFDVVISDIIMPNLTGYEVCKQIKMDTKKSKTPVILLTTLSDPMEVIHALECGADNFITKPYQDELLIKRIKDVLLSKESKLNSTNENFELARFLDKEIMIPINKGQILGLLLSTFEDIVRTNNELQENKAELEYKNREIEKINLRLEVEMKAAQQALRGLFPKVEYVENFITHPIKIALFNQSASEVGGDWCGFYNIGKYKLVLIGDVTGHGAGSAVVAASVSGYFESLANSKLSEEIDLITLYKNLSQFIKKIGNDEFCMTMAMLLFDEDMNNYYYLNAGHNHPFIVSYKDTNNIEIKKALLSGHILGHVPDENSKNQAEIQINKFEFKNDSMLILYTDGLTENANKLGEQYDENRLKKFFQKNNFKFTNPLVIINKVIDEIYNFYDGYPIQDDITLILIKKGAKSIIEEEN